MELAHVILIHEFFDKVRKIFDKNLVTQHKIFQNSVDLPWHTKALTTSQVMRNRNATVAEERKRNLTRIGQAIPGFGQNAVARETAPINEPRFNDKLLRDAAIEEVEDEDAFIHLDLLRTDGMNNNVSKDTSTNHLSYLDEYLERVRRRSTIASSIRATRLRRQSRMSNVGQNFAINRESMISGIITSRKSMANNQAPQFQGRLK